MVCTQNVHVYIEAKDRCDCGRTGRIALPPHKSLAVDGFHRIGRLDEVGRRSLWLRDENRAFELCAGREGNDGRVRIELGESNPIFNGTIKLPEIEFQAIHNVIGCARFAAEWEQEGGNALDESYALDAYPHSLYRSK